MLHSLQILVAKFREGYFSLRVVYLRFRVFEGGQFALREFAIRCPKAAAYLLATNLDPRIVDAA